MVVGAAMLGYGSPVGGKGDRPSLENRWWVDQGKGGRPIERPPARFGNVFFRTGSGFQQDRAQRRLTDSNLKWFDEAPGEPGAWSVLHVLDKERFPPQRLDKVKRLLAVPPRCRGVLVDSGRSLRAIVSTVPIGERLIELRLGEDASFDAWVRGEWVREVIFRGVDDALRRAPRLIRDYLTNGRAEPLV